MLRRRPKASSAPVPPPPPADPLATLDLTAVADRHVALVRQAVAAQRSWDQVTGRVAAGPLADRLGQLGERLVASVLELYGAARRIRDVELVLASLDPDGATRAYKAARRQAAQGQPPVEMEALEARFGSVQRLLNVVADADEQLAVLDARLLAAAARGAEVALTADAEALGAIGTDLDLVVSELGALRGALGAVG